MRLASLFRNQNWFLKYVPMYLTQKNKKGISIWAPEILQKYNFIHYSSTPKLERVRISDTKFYQTWDKKLDRFICIFFIAKTTKLFAVRNPNKYVWISDFIFCLKTELVNVPISAFSHFGTFSFWGATVYSNIPQLSCLKPNSFWVSDKLVEISNT